MKKLWTDLHSNIHHNQMDELDKWVEHAKATLDFWPIEMCIRDRSCANYPDESGAVCIAVHFENEKSIYQLSDLSFAWNSWTACVRCV